ncbi:MAG: hypothetical protein MI922_15260, partial [Bacteroidales bacterium]|nr:hypothetical protein [Bacteroidales bacterium]
TEEENKQVSKFSMVLKDSTIYAFSFASSLKYPGKLVFELYDNHKQLLGKNYIESNDRYFNNFSFKCMKTGIYHMHIYFKDGKEGVGVGVLSFVRKIQDKSCESQ